MELALSLASRYGIYAAGTLGLGLLAKSLTITVPHGHEAIVLWMGAFQRVIGPGMHFLWYPMQTIATFHASWEEEDHNGDLRTRTWEFQAIPKTLKTFDVAPIEATSSDRIKVRINLVFHFRLLDSQKLLEVANFARILEHGTKSLITTYANSRTAQAIKGDGIGPIAEYINEESKKNMAAIGLEIVSTLVQDISVDADADKQIVDIQRKARVAQMEMDHNAQITEANLKKRRLELDAERSVELMQIETKKRRREAELAVELAEEDAKIELEQKRLEQAKLRADAELCQHQLPALLLEKMKSDGTLEGYVQMEHSKVMAAAIGKLNPRLMAADMDALMKVAVMDRLLPAGDGSV